MIEIGIIGRIVSGRNKGHFLEVKELRPEDPPSYLVLTAEDYHFTLNGEDVWVEDHAALQQLFDENQWTIDWNGDALPDRGDE
ncbi:hypothetical protein [Streptomyces sp. PU-14G]|uniref:hypothetical protein n=1 Tax=Streptomyces sp. PU-14G TaxID=2800808 RepID=UPI0034DF6E16